jgi:hypothetical protein
MSEVMVGQEERYRCGFVALVDEIRMIFVFIRVADCSLYPLY